MDPKVRTGREFPFPGPKMEQTHVNEVPTRSKRKEETSGKQVGKKEGMNE